MIADAEARTKSVMEENADLKGTLASLTKEVHQTIANHGRAVEWAARRHMGRRASAGGSGGEAEGEGDGAGEVDFAARLELPFAWVQADFEADIRGKIEKLKLDTERLRLAEEAAEAAEAADAADAEGGPGADAAAVTPGGGGRGGKTNDDALAIIGEQDRLIRALLAKGAPGRGGPGRGCSPMDILRLDHMNSSLRNPDDSVENDSSAEFDREVFKRELQAMDTDRKLLDEARQQFETDRNHLTKQAIQFDEHKLRFVSTNIPNALARSASKQPPSSAASTPPHFFSSPIASIEHMEFPVQPTPATKKVRRRKGRAIPVCGGAWWRVVSEWWWCSVCIVAI
jgi:hypothetical protein